MVSRCRQLAFHPVVTVWEQALAHIIADETEAAYRRSDALAKRRRLMDEWAAYCTSES